MATLPRALLSELPLFVLLVEEQSFTAAARVLGLPKSTVSRRLSRLEDRLGVQLLIRTTRQMRLTAAGEELLHQARQLISMVENIEESLKHGQNAMAGTLRIAGPPILAEHWLTPAITRFLHKYSDVKVELDIEARFVDLIAERFDLAVRVGHLNDSSIMARKIGIDGPKNVASPAYLDKYGAPTKPEDLEKHNCLRYSEQGSALKAWTFNYDGKTRSVNVKGNFYANSYDALLNGALEGMGITRVPNLLCLEHIRKGNLVSLLEDWMPEPPGIYLVYPSSKYLSRLTRTFLDFLIEDATEYGLALN